MLDIDHFKGVNDTYGHKVGDNILSDVASIIKKVIRSDDIFIRFGGEEFLLFIRRKNTKEMLATQIAERIRYKIEEKIFTYDTVSLKITISIGITCSPQHFKTISEAIKHADELLYIAKREGRNRVVSDMNAKEIPKYATQNLHINDIKDAIEENRLICHYQAIFCTQTQKIAKYEALVRIKNRDGSLIYPNEFLPNIVHTNLYNQMTKMILDIVFEKIKRNKVTISVNLNFSDIINKNIFKLIVEELEHNKDVAPWLTIELLEYEVLEAQHSFEHNIATIQSYGVKIAIDDFGAGFANYNVFQILQINTIKIDGSLIKNIDTSPTSYKIVKSIKFLTEELGIETVAEFVHSKEVYATVKELGITKVQGFYLAKPQATLLSGDKTP
jgi:diguanylate cyclase (GGDEF)-like protein